MKSVLTGVAVVAAAILVPAHDAPAQQVKLFMSSMSPGGSSNSKLYNEWGRKIEADSKNTVSVEVKDGVTLASFTNVIDRVNADVLQIGWTMHAFYRGKFPLSEVGALPFVSDDQMAGAEATWRLYKTGLLDSEYKDLVPLWIAMTGFTGIHLAKPIASLDEIKGKKIRVAGESQKVMGEQLGMSPQSIPANDMYVALQRGTLDALFTSWAAFVPYKLYEVTSYHIEVPLGTSSTFVFMSRKKLASLPAAARQAVEMNAGDHVNKMFAKHFTDQAAEGREMSIKHSARKLMTPPADVVADWKNRIGGAVVADWLKDNPDGQKVLDAFRKIYAEVKAGS
jgi:TRAP-type C4-dicarboxylate transport system substrate-binding protein